MVKTRLQNQTVAADGSRMYRNPIHCFQTIVKTEGVAGLYRGIIPNLIGVTPEKALKLGCNDLFREKLSEADGSITLPNEMLAGGGAGFCQVAATNPMEITKIRMQVQATLPIAERQSLGQVVSHLGFTGMYRGVVATWMRDVPYSFIFFPLYANLHKSFADASGHVSMPKTLAAGGIAGASAAFVCTPMDVVKTRLQVQGGSARYNGLLDCWKKVYAEEGFGAFFKGAVPRMAVTAPLFGIALLCFELQKEYIIKSRSGGN
eukprot:g2040.t1